MARPLVRARYLTVRSTASRMFLPRRTIGFIVFAIAVSLGCVRLGVWQLSRLADRQARNRVIEGRLRAPIAPASTLHGSADSLRYRPVSLAGRFDYSNELLLSGRARNGSPGVWLLTPLRRTGEDTATLVIRGWVYAADGKSVDLSTWHEGDSVDVSGYVDTYHTATASVTVPGASRAIRVDDRDSVAARLPYPVAGFVIVQTSDSIERADRPARLRAPAVDDGPHRSYAIQWFAFAAIAWIGIGAVVWKARGTRTA